MYVCMHVHIHEHIQQNASQSSEYIMTFHSNTTYELVLGWETKAQ